MDRATVLSTVQRVGSWIGALCGVLAAARPARGRGRVSAPLALATVAILLGLVSGTVYAHTVKQTEWTYRSGADCSKGHAELGHGSGGGRTNGRSESWYRSSLGPMGDIHCGVTWNRPDNHLALRVIYYYWTGASWHKCRDTDWTYNVGSQWKMEDGNDYSSPRCGSGWYGTWTGAYVNNGGWHGGSVWSGYHWLP